jgi:hypothetical protein
MQQDYDDAGYGDSADYDDMGDEYTTPHENAVGASAEVPAADLEHISGEQVRGLQRKVIAPVVIASAAQLSRKPELAEWRVPLHLHKEFHKNTAISNRHAPAPEHLEGELDQMFITKMRVIGFANGHAQPVEMHISNQLGETISIGNKSAFLMGPTAGLEVATDVDIHSPVDFMTRNMLEIWEACDPSVLKNEFSSVGQGENAMPAIGVDGVAARLLRTKPELFGGYQLDLSRMVPGTRFCMVDKEVGNNLFKYMESTINGIKNNFTSPKDLVVTFRPVTGKWDNDSLLLGDQVGLTPDKKLFHTQHAKEKQNLLMVKIDTQYGVVSVMFPETKK